jgi:hypothetical protein
VSIECVCIGRKPADGLSSGTQLVIDGGQVKVQPFGKFKL